TGRRLSAEPVWPDRIDASCRPTMRAKAQAKDALDDLRLKVLRAELGAPADAARIDWVARERIEMHRALDLHLVDDEVSNGATTRGSAAGDVSRADRPVDAMRHRLLDRPPSSRAGKRPGSRATCSRAAAPRRCVEAGRPRAQPASRGQAFAGSARHRMAR